MKPCKTFQRLINVRLAKLLIILGILTTAVFFADQMGLATGITQKLTLPFKVAALYLEEPDKRLLMPVEGVAHRQVADTWGGPRSGGRKHQGQDIFAKRGTRIYSATDGYVIRVGENQLGGNTVFVMGSGGRSYYYAHLDKYAEGLSVGQHVTPETVLGYVGDTGNAKGTPPHLHFGVYTSGGALNPLPLLKDRE
jgi:peptidoglycan LD-endopeptidase LytH